MVDATRIPYTIKNTFVEIEEESRKRESPGLPRCSSESSLNSSRKPPSPAELKDFSDRSCSGSGSEGSPRFSGEQSKVVPDKSSMNVSPETLAICKSLVRVAMDQNKAGADGGSWSEADVSDVATSKAARQKLHEALKDVLPFDHEGNKMSMGSILHSFGPHVGSHCQPCSFWMKRRCMEGESCLRCHYSRHDRNQDEARQKQKFLDRRRMVFETPQTSSRKEAQAQIYDAYTSGTLSGGSRGGSSRAASDHGSLGDESSQMSNSRGSSFTPSPANESGTVTPVTLEDVQDLPTPSMAALEFYQRVIVRDRDILRVMPDAGSPQELKEYVPLDAEQNFTSIGSIMHYLRPVGEHCKACLFWLKSECRNGERCAYCHISHLDQKKKKLRPSKATRDANRSKGTVPGSEASSQSKQGYSAGSLRGMGQGTRISL